jgi:hypothetical protein
MNRYLSKKFIAERNLLNTFIDFLWWTEVRTEVRASAMTLGISFWIFEPPYLEEKWLTFDFIFFVDKYWRWKHSPRKKIGILLTIFLRRMQMRTGGGIPYFGY